MKTGTKVRITKESAAVDAPYPTPPKEDYKPGKDNGPVSLPVDYEVVGTLMSDLALGGRLYVDRTHRNGVEVRGVLLSSPIVGFSLLEKDTIRVLTRNSVYIVEPL